MALAMKQMVPYGPTAGVQAPVIFHATASYPTAAVSLDGCGTAFVFLPQHLHGVTSGLFPPSFIHDDCHCSVKFQVLVCLTLCAPLLYLFTLFITNSEPSDFRF
ncbi:hypothetical protein TRVL_10209 [Trypanosoma vivax]|nr:hypothetical protein TRVL_10209 [Trypanosoma vivax]